MPASEFVCVLVVLLGIAMLITGTCRNLPVPFTVILVLVGLLLGKLSHLLHIMEQLQDFSLSPEIMLCYAARQALFANGFPGQN